MTEPAPKANDSEASSEGNSSPAAAVPIRILIVDDEEVVRLALAKFLRSRGYVVETADTGAAALHHILNDGFDLMLCDVRMPGMNGLEVVPRALAADPNLAVVMLTAVNDAPTARGALVGGALDYLLKPVELTNLQNAVERALHRRRLDMERRRVEELIRDEVASRTRELEQEKRALAEMTVQIIETLTSAMEAKDVYLRGHSQRVADLAASIAAEMTLDEDVVEYVRLAGRVMDVGKIGIRESVVNKPATLTAEEFEHVRSHVQIGMEILSPLRHLGPALRFVQDHHERMDGKGYPRALAGDQISIGGRILAAADAFHALTSKRAYRGSMSAHEALEHLGRDVGAFLDRYVYDALCAVVRRHKSLVFIASEGQ